MSVLTHKKMRTLTDSCPPGLPASLVEKTHITHLIVNQLIEHVMDCVT